MNLARILTQILFLLVSHGSLYASAHWFFGKHLYKDYEVKRVYVRHLFSTTFTVSVSMLQCLLFELLDLFVTDLRRLVWRLNFTIMIALVYLIIPIGLTYSITSLFNKSWRTCIIASFAALLPLWWCFYQAGRLIKLPLPSDIPLVGTLVTELSTELLFARIGVCGVIVVAALGGYGSVVFPYENISLFLSQVHKRDAVELENRLLNTVESIATKKTRRAVLEMQLKSFESSANSNNTSQTHGKDTSPTLDPAQAPSSGGLWNAVKFRLTTLKEKLSVVGVTGGSAEAEMRREVLQLSGEVKSLEGLSRELFAGYADTLEQQARSKQAATSMGRLKNSFGWVMSGVCLYRVVMSTANVVLRRRQMGDVGTNVLKKTCYYLGLPSWVMSFAPYINLLMLGWLISMNIRGFVDRLLVVFRLFSTSGTSNMFALIMSEIMGLYFCAYAVLLRVYLPEEYRARVTEVIGPSLDFDDFHWTSDWVSVVASLLTLGYLAFNHFTKFSKTYKASRGKPNSDVHKPHNQA